MDDTIHFSPTSIKDEDQRMSCGKHITDILDKTKAFPENVTCGGCKRTKAFKEAYILYQKYRDEIYPSKPIMRQDSFGKPL